MTAQCLEDKRVLDYLETADREEKTVDSTPDVNASDLILETIPRALSQKEVGGAGLVLRESSDFLKTPEFLV